MAFSRAKPNEQGVQDIMAYAGSVRVFRSERAADVIEILGTDPKTLRVFSDF